jgi:hypothetical protein
VHQAGRAALERAGGNKVEMKFTPILRWSWLTPRPSVEVPF